MMAYRMDTYKIFSAKAGRKSTRGKKKVITQAINFQSNRASVETAPVHV